jgi:predicted RND superfamily exporter protein
VPLAIAGSIPGHEIEHPMAIVILGGLVTATLLNLFVLPSLYLKFAKSRRDRERLAAAGGADGGGPRADEPNVPSPQVA